MRTLAVALALLVGLSASLVRAHPKISRSTKLTKKSYPDVRKAILPSAAETRWKGIAWRPSLAVALEEARKKDRPILLWMMNGHPCGMT